MEIKVEKCDPSKCQKCDLSEDEKKLCEQMYQLMLAIESTPQAERWDKWHEVGRILSMSAGQITTLIADDPEHALLLLTETLNVSLRPWAGELAVSLLKRLTGKKATNTGPDLANLNMDGATRH